MEELVQSSPKDLNQSQRRNREFESSTSYVPRVRCRVSQFKKVSKQVSM